MKKKKYFGGMGFFLAIMIILVLATSLFDQTTAGEVLKYSDVLNHFESGQVESFVIDDDELTYQLNDDGKLSATERVKEYKLYSAGLFLNDVDEAIAEQRQAGTLEYDICL